MVRVSSYATGNTALVFIDKNLELRAKTNRGIDLRAVLYIAVITLSFLRLEVSSVI